MWHSNWNFLNCKWIMAWVLGILVRVFLLLCMYSSDIWTEAELKLLDSEEVEVTMCFLLCQNTCQLLQRIQKVIFWSLQQRFSMILFSQVTWCIHESLFYRTSEGCVQRAYGHSLLQEQSEVWSHLITFNAI